MKNLLVIVVDQGGEETEETTNAGPTVGSQWFYKDGRIRSFVDERSMMNEPFAGGLVVVGVAVDVVKRMPRGLTYSLFCGAEVFSESAVATTVDGSISFNVVDVSLE